jgi:cytochrome c oxidase subunit II
MAPARRPHVVARRRLAVLGVVTMSLSTSCSERFGAPASATDEGEAFLDLWRVFFLGGLLVTALIWALVAISVIRFRRRSPDYPSQRQYNIPWEIGYTVVPLVIVAILFGLTLVGQHRFVALADDPDLRVEVVGFQWQWQFRYEDDEVALSGTEQDMPVLVLPVGETVRLRLFTEDVNHSFWVPEFLEKRDLIPHVDNEIDVVVKEPGRWRGRCAEYCGLDHWKMSFDVQAVPRDQFDAWVRAMRDLPQPVLAPDAPEAGA